MNMATTHNWYEANQRALVDALASVRHALELHIKNKNGEAQPIPAVSASTTLAILPASDPASSESEMMVGPSALEALCTTFGLSPFERDVLLLCAGIELDTSFAALCAVAQDDAQRSYPTFSLALAALPNAHWSALAPSGTLRRWRLLEIGNGSPLTASPLRID